MLLDKLGKFLDKAIDSGLLNQTATYLVRFGYITPEKLDSLEDIAHAIRRFHSMAGIGSGDVITLKTLKAMTAPRCNLTDAPETEEAGSISKWGITKLGYYIASRDADMSANVWDATIAAALKSVSDICGLEFYQTDSQSNANLVYTTGRGKADDFDGSSGVLAWFQLPPSSSYKGQLFGKFDQDERWIGLGQTGSGILFQNVVCHETLHGLGLSHTNVPGSLMNPFYSPQIVTPQAEDIRQLKDLRYGPPKVASNPSGSIPKPDQPSGTVVINITGSVSKIDIPGYRIQKIG